MRLAALLIASAPVAAAEPATPLPPLRERARVEVKTPFDGWQLGRVEEVDSFVEVRLDRPLKGKREVTTLGRRVRPIDAETERALRRAGPAAVGDRVDVATFDGWKTAVVLEIDANGTFLTVAFDDPETRGSNRLFVEDARPLPEGVEPRVDVEEAPEEADAGADTTAEPDAEAAPLGTIPEAAKVFVPDELHWAAPPVAEAVRRPAAPRSIRLEKPSDSFFLSAEAPMLGGRGTVGVLWRLGHTDRRAWVQVAPGGGSSTAGRAVALPRVPRSATLSPDGGTLFLFGDDRAARDGRLTRVDLRTGAVTAEFSVPDGDFTSGVPRALDGSRVLLAADDRATMWDAEKAEALWSVGLGFGAGAATPAIDGPCVFVVEEGRVLVLDAATGEPLARSAVVAPGARVASLSPAGDRLLLAGGGGLVVLDAGSGAVTSVAPAPSGAAGRTVDWLDGGRFAVLDRGWVVDTEPGRGFAAGRLTGVPREATLEGGTLFHTEPKADPPRVSFSTLVSDRSLDEMIGIVQPAIWAFAAPDPVAVDPVSTGDAAADREATEALVAAVRGAGFTVDPAAAVRLVPKAARSNGETIPFRELHGGREFRVTQRVWTYTLTLERGDETLWTGSTSRSFGPSGIGIERFATDRPAQTQVDERAVVDPAAFAQLRMPSRILHPEYANGVIPVPAGG